MRPIPRMPSRLSVRDENLTDSGERRRSARDGRPYQGRPHHHAAGRSLGGRGPLGWRVRHCFPQCTRPIHSARAPEPPPDALPCKGRTSAVRRRSAARGGPSPEEPPLAASLPARLSGAGQNTPPAPAARHLAGRTPLGPFVPARRGITPGSAPTGRDCLAARDDDESPPRPGLRPEHRERSRAPPTQATLPHNGLAARAAAGASFRSGADMSAPAGRSPDRQASALPR